MSDTSWIVPRRVDSGLRSSHNQRLFAAKATRIKNQIAGWERAVQTATPPFRQCQHIIKKFGGIVPFAVAVGVHPADIVQYWLASPLARPKGQRGLQRPANREPTGGFIPSAVLPRMLRAARHYGILILPEDLYPDFTSEHHYKDKMQWIKSIPKSEKMRDFEHVLASLASTPV